MPRDKNNLVGFGFTSFGKWQFSEFNPKKFKIFEFRNNLKHSRKFSNIIFESN